MKTRTRDMTDREFRAALKRNGFRAGLMGIWINDRVSIGYTLRLPEVTIMRRTSLARAIQAAKRNQSRTKAG